MISLLGVWVICAGPLLAAGATLSHGPMVGAVSDVGVKIWARVGGVPPLTYSLAAQYGEVGDPTGSTSSSVTLSEEGDFTGTVEIAGLESGTDHWFELLLNDVVVLLHLGDSIYADREPPATSRAEFEARYKLNFDESNWRALMREIPSFMIWDDHEIENNWDEGQTGLYLEARPAFEEYVAGHNPEPRVPGQLYYDFTVGEVDFFVLDTRTFRDPSTATMLGSTQLVELQSWLAASTAVFKFIVSSVQWSTLSQNADTWFGFPAERGEIFDFVRTNGIRGVVLLSGDRHWMALFRHEAVAPYFLYEFSSSPLGALVDEAPPPDSETSFLGDASRAFLTIDADTTLSPAALDVRVVDETGTELFLLSLTEDDIFDAAIFADGFESGDVSAWSTAVP